MARFQVSDSANHENPGFNIDGEHQRFHEAVIALQTELTDKAAPAFVTRAQADGAINAFSDVKMSFFRLRKFEHTTERLCGSMRALYGGTSCKTGDSQESFREVWHGQRKLAELLCYEIIRIGRNLSDVSPTVRDLLGSMPARIHSGAVTREELKDALRTLWGSVLRRLLHELGSYR